MASATLLHDITPEEFMQSVRVNTLSYVLCGNVLRRKAQLTVPLELSLPSSTPRWLWGRQTRNVENPTVAAV